MEKIVFKKFDWIDFGRGIAILLVIMVHTGQSFFKIPFLKNIYDTGDKGVQLFFILSAITLFNSYNNRGKLDGAQTKLFFFIRRFFRISFIYYFFIIFYTFFEILINGVTSVSFWPILSSSLFLNGLIYIPTNLNIPPGGWSIGVEMFFYLFIPILFSMVKSTKKSLVLLVVAIITSNLLGMVAKLMVDRLTNLDYKLLSDTTFYFWLPNQFPVFCIGIFLFYFLKSNKVSFIAQRVSLSASILLFLIFSQVEFSSEFPFHFFKKEYVFSLIFGLLILGIQDFKFNNFLGNIFLKIGKYSFSM